MKRFRVGVVLSALVLSTLTAAVQAPTAAALAPTDSFSADALSTWQTDGTVYSIASAGGLVFAGGNFAHLRAPGTAVGDASSIGRADLAVLNAATGAPTSCVLNVTRGTSSALVRAVAVSPDGKTLYVGGLFTAIAGVGRANLAAIDIASCTVLPFNPNVSSFVYAITATATAVYFGGNFASVRGVARSDLAAVAPVTATLLPWAPTADDDVLALNIDPNNGNVIIGGRLNYLNGVFSHALGVVDGSTGTTNVMTYPQGFFPYTPGVGQRNGTSVVKSIAVDSTGFYTGSEGTGFHIFDGRVAFNTGTYAQRWRDNCYGATQAVLAYKGQLLWGSHSHDCSSEGWWEDGARHFFGQESLTAKQLQPWLPQADNGIGEGIGPRALNLATSGTATYLWTGGDFTHINGVSQQGLSRFGSTDTGNPANMYPPEAFATVPGQVRVVWRSTLDTDDAALTYYVYRNGGTTPIGSVQASSFFFSRPQVSFVDKNVVAGQTYSYTVRGTDGINWTPYSLPAKATVLSKAVTGYPAQIMADGAATYFRSDDPAGTNLIMAGSQGSGNLDAVYDGAVTRSTGSGAIIGDPSYAMTFDGTASYAHTELRQAGPSVFSLELWFKTTSTSGGKLIGFGDRADTNSVEALSATYDRQLYLTNAGAVVFGIYDGSMRTLTSAAGLNNGQWHHVVGTESSAGMAFYVDGVSVGTNTAIKNPRTMTGFWRIGGDNVAGWPNAPTSNFFGGSLDEVAIYPTALSATQVANHYKLSGRTPAGAVAGVATVDGAAGTTAATGSTTVSPAPTSPAPTSATITTSGAPKTGGSATTGTTGAGSTTAGTTGATPSGGSASVAPVPTTTAAAPTTVASPSAAPGSAAAWSTGSAVVTAGSATG